MQLDIQQILLVFAFLALFITAIVLFLPDTQITRSPSNDILEKAQLEQEKNEKQKTQKNLPHYQEFYGYFKKFIENNLQQNRNIYVLTVVMIIAGFLMIAFGIMQFQQQLSESIQGQPWPAVVAGVLTEFIATTILYVYSSVFRQTEAVFKSLERLTAIGTAIRILDDLSDDKGDATLKELQSKTKADVAKLLIQLQHATSLENGTATATEIHKRQEEST